MCIFVYALCFLLTASTPFEWKSVLVTTAPNSALDSGNWTTELVGANETDVAFTLVNTELGKNAWYRFVYHWFTTITFVIVPLIILAIGNLFLIYALRKSRKEREALTNQQFYQKQYRVRFVLWKGSKLLWNTNLKLFYQLCRRCGKKIRLPLR